jgi:hypothetical protein
MKSTRRRKAAGKLDQKSEGPFTAIMMESRMMGNYHVRFGKGGAFSASTKTGSTRSAQRGGSVSLVHPQGSNLKELTGAYTNGGACGLIRVRPAKDPHTLRLTCAIPVGRGEPTWTCIPSNRSVPSSRDNVSTTGSWGLYTARLNGTRLTKVNCAL